MNNSQSYLAARVKIATNLFQEGKITRAEIFRLEMDLALGENTGDIEYKDNVDFNCKLM